MKIKITLACNFKPNEQIDIRVEYTPNNLKLTPEQATMLKGAATIAIKNIPQARPANQ